jgi:putative PIN family toxin of toxin-antitoxin system
MITAVSDANIYISALISGKGASARLVELLAEKNLSVAMSTAIFAEIGRVVRYPRISRKYHLTEVEIEEFLDLLREQVVWVEPDEVAQVIEADPDDDKYLACAITADAQFIVSGDRHLRDLERYRGIEILTPMAFLAYLRTNAFKVSKPKD